MHLQGALILDWSGRKLPSLRFVVTRLVGFGQKEAVRAFDF